MTSIVEIPSEIKLPFSNSYPRPFEGISFAFHYRQNREGALCVETDFIGHFKPPLTATIEIVFEVIYIRFW